MCGIFGTINLPVANPQKILDALAHRGPDASGRWQSQNVRFFHTRLAVQELSDGGAQPMQHQHLVVVFNGEIYNHLALRKKFNLACTSGSDTETLLHLYEKMGAQMLDELDGMFAFAIADTRVRKLLLARDRAGVKPLYVYQSGAQLAFSSELGALQTALGLLVDERTVGQFLAFGYFPGYTSPYQCVEKVLPGQFYLVDYEHFEVKKTFWWRAESFYLQPTKMPLADACAQTELYLQTAVDRRLQASDREVGVFLSGGIDSGLVTAMAAQRQAKLQTFTVSMPANAAFDEAPLARQVAERYNTRHTQIEISFENLSHDLESILGRYGEPFADSSAILSFYVAKEAKKHVTVVLNGDGADELFAGYRRYVPFAHIDFANLPPWSRAVAQKVQNTLPPPNGKRNAYDFGYRLLELLKTTGLQQYLAATTDLFEPNLLAPNHHFADPSTRLTALQRMQLLDFEHLLPNDLLPKIDIATMAHALEARSPFLSKELLEFAPTLADAHKIKGLTTKYVLRKIAQKYLPEQIVNQPKRGFEIPLKDWVNGPLKPIMYDYLSCPKLVGRLVEPQIIEALLQNNAPREAPEKRARLLYALFCVEVWYQRSYCP